MPDVLSSCPLRTKAKESFLLIECEWLLLREQSLIPLNILGPARGYF